MPMPAWGPEQFGDYRSVDGASSKPGRRTSGGQAWAPSCHLDKAGRPLQELGPLDGCARGRAGAAWTWYDGACGQGLLSGSGPPAGRPTKKKSDPAVAELLQHSMLQQRVAPHQRSALCAAIAMSEVKQAFTTERENVATFAGASHAAEGAAAGAKKAAAREADSWEVLAGAALESNQSAVREVVIREAAAREAAARQTTTRKVAVDKVAAGSAVERDDARLKARASPAAEAIRNACAAVGRNAEADGWAIALDRNYLSRLDQLQALGASEWARLSLPDDLQLELQRQLRLALPSPAPRGPQRQRSARRQGRRPGSAPPGRQPGRVSDPRVAAKR